MLGKICPPRTLMFLICLNSLAVNAFGKESAASNISFELAPLKGVMGQVSLRAERRQSEQWAFGVAYENVVQPGERENFEDESTRFFADVFWYPKVEEPYRGVFFGAGAIVEQATVGRSENRKYISGTTPTVSETKDKWSNNTNYYSVSQTVGYRYSIGPHLTASLRYVIDELVYQQSSTQDEEIYSYGVETDAERRQAVKQYLAFLAGVVF